MSTELLVGGLNTKETIGKPMRVSLWIFVIGVCLLFPIYMTHPAFDLDSLTAYYLSGFIFVEVSLFLLRNTLSRPKLKLS